MRFPPILTAVIACCLFTLSASAQVFPNAPWNKNNTCANGQCQATFGPGSIDPFGHVVVSVGPIADPLPSAPNVMAFAPTPTLAPDVNEVSILARRSDFRQAFLTAVRQARDDGKINALQHGRLVIASLRPRELANIQAWMHENAIQEGLATAQAPDWGAIIDFIERLIPLIIQLIDLFASNVNPPSDYQYTMLAPQTESRVLCDWTWTGLAS